MTVSQTSGAYRPLTLAQTRAELAADRGELMRRLGAAAQADGHNSVVAANFDVSADRRHGSLAGVPVGVKDNIDVVGFATTGGSRALRDHHPEADAACIAALRAAGAVFPCKLNMHELAFGVTSDNSAFGRVLNPFDAGRTAGGSSGGSAAAVARGIVPVALGTDTGGSVRIPASFCGMVGFRPSTGRYPSGGALPLSPTRDTVGPIAATLADVVEIDALIAGNPAALPTPPGRALRLGLPADALPGLSAPVETTFRLTLGSLEASGVVEIVALPAVGLEGMERDMGLPIVFKEAGDMWGGFCAETLGCSLADFAAGLGDAHVRATFAALPALRQETAARFAAGVAAHNLSTKLPRRPGTVVCAGDGGLSSHVSSLSSGFPDG